MNKRKKNNPTESDEDESNDITLKVNEQVDITTIIDYFNNNHTKGIHYILKQINEFLDIRLFKKYIIQYLIEQNKHGTDTISYNSNRITLQLIAGKYTINEKKKLVLMNAIIKNNLWNKYIDYIINITGNVFSNIKNILYLFKLNPIHIYDTLKDIFKPYYLHQYIDSCKINISKKLQYLDIIEHFEKENLIKSFWNNVCINNIKLYPNKPEQIVVKPDYKFELGLEYKNTFVYKSTNDKRQLLIQNNRQKHLVTVKIEL
jgi:hypothetical protein